ncbi:hypothetical protein BKI52_12555 [marine bacterium AO1-C]|nr:hypothetical protein BKI52_12555 [marine bacterium AO1-C]
MNLKTKTVLLLAMLFAVCVGYGQDKSNPYGLEFPLDKEGNVEYKKVVNLPDTKKSELRKRCALWFAKEFKSSNDVIQNNSEDNILGKGFTKIYINTGFEKLPVDVHFTISVDFKENKYRYRINNITYQAQTGPKVSIQQYQKRIAKKKKRGKKVFGYTKQYVEKTNKEIHSMCMSLEKEMSTKDDDF